MATRLVFHYIYISCKFQSMYWFLQFQVQSTLGILYEYRNTFDLHGYGYGCVHAICIHTFGRHSFAHSYEYEYSIRTEYRLPFGTIRFGKRHCILNRKGKCLHRFDSNSVEFTDCLTIAGRWTDGRTFGKELNIVALKT